MPVAVETGFLSLFLALSLALPSFFISPPHQTEVMWPLWRQTGQADRQRSELVCRLQTNLLLQLEVCQWLLALSRWITPNFSSSSPLSPLLSISSSLYSHLSFPAALPFIPACCFFCSCCWHTLAEKALCDGLLSGVYIATNEVRFWVVSLCKISSCLFSVLLFAG